MGRADGHRPAITRRPGKGQALTSTGSDAKDRIIYPLEKHVVNPIVLLAWDLGLPPPGDALLETTGRRTGQPRRTPVCDGLDGDTFWLVAQRGHSADWVLEHRGEPARPGQVPQRFRHRLAGRDGAHPRRGRPASGSGSLAQANLARRWCVRVSAAMGTSPLTVRIDLDTR